MPAHAYPELLELVASGRLQPERLVTRELSLDEAGEALADGRIRRRRQCRDPHVMSAGVDRRVGKRAGTDRLCCRVSARGRHAVRAAVAPGSSATCYPTDAEGELPSRSGVGQDVTVTGDAFTCGTRYANGKTYTVTFGKSGSEKPLGSEVVSVDRDGSFVAHVRFPASTRAGMAWISIAGSPYDKTVQGHRTAA